jgi:hypothetical protein
LVREVEIKVYPDRIHDKEYLLNQALAKAKVIAMDVKDFIVVKKSIDARSKRPFFLLKINLYIGEQFKPAQPISLSYKNVERAQSIVIIGSGPAGYFAALECLSLGLKPIILERGKDVQSRRRDLKSIQQYGEVNPHSNYCFGEGGAGTYSDGKLYTRSQKRGSIIKVLQQLVEHGADPNILVDAHPHIGSNKLP